MLRSKKKKKQTAYGRAYGVAASNGFAPKKIFLRKTFRGSPPRKLLKVLRVYNVEGIEGIKMVNNKMKILDEGKIKFVAECIEMKRWYETDSLYFVFAHSDEQTLKSTSIGEDLNEMNIDVENKNYVEPSRKFITWKEKCFKESIGFGLIPNDNYRFSDNPYKDCVTKFWTKQEILDYMKIIPFTPSVMINISPNWNGKGIDRRTNKCKITILKGIIDKYMKEGWYDKWNYVIECGSEGNHIHAHIVAHMNPQRLKSTESHLRRGNHTRQLMKYANKVEGMAGMIEGVSVQKTILRTEELVKDKLDYLIEEKKPEGHKNLQVLEDCLISGEL